MTLTIGDPREAPSRAPVGSASTAGTVPQCPRPQLSMALDQGPLRTLRGRPVLRAHGRYTAAITLRQGGRRVANVTRRFTVR